MRVCVCARAHACVRVFACVYAHVCVFSSSKGECARASSVGVCVCVSVSPYVGVSVHVCSKCVGVHMCVSCTRGLRECTHIYLSVSGCVCVCIVRLISASHMSFQLKSPTDAISNQPTLPQ